MYACICHNITDQKLEETFNKNNGDMKETLRSLGMGKSCGICLMESMEKLSSQKTSKSDAQKVD